MTVTIKNGTGANYDPAIFHASIQSGDEAGQAVFDSAQGIESAPQTALLPGKSVNFKLAFGVKDPNDLVLQVQPGFEYKPALFTS